jgi:hypothetical protein
MNLRITDPLESITEVWDRIMGVLTGAADLARCVQSTNPKIYVISTTMFEEGVVNVSKVYKQRKEVMDSIQLHLSK